MTAFLRTRRLSRTLKTRADVEAWQAERITAWLRETVAAAPFYRGRRIEKLDDLPVVDKSVLMAAFEKFNRAGVTREEGWRAVESGRPPKGYSVGASTGTSGNRGLFVISHAERYEWLGVIVAKLLPGFPLEKARIALILPLNTALYGAVNRTGRLRLRFFDLRRGVATLTPEVVAFRPDTIIAPPTVLRWLAEHDRSLRPKRLFSSAEVLDPIDRDIVEARYDIRLREIYMATEGLLATSCAHGTLHLAEDVVHFELEPVPESDLVSPIVSDFTRETQAMARYRMNDLLRLKNDACLCGSPLRAVAEVVGRSDDIFVLSRAGGEGSIPVTPDVLRNAILNADRRIADFRLAQTGRRTLSLTLPKDLLAETVEAACAALSNLLRNMGAEARIAAVQQDLPPPTVKLRRVERRWRAEET
ncbi:CoF synthetase [Mesorhizobium sp. LHD-90]|uniref:F390 synthetase-related protein n=1 Tax=Mesorhizobium sp. LHD-90 TaxID=3071414 RepID=UPI0027E1DE37|nr:F390 synthetase-related protein [Mesorhizobium sp. LHD-90]MDQ6436274.1 CoF synthetase [Mesorhizobium sp. LHD-90]